MQIGRHNQLQEWLEDVDSPTDDHRHILIFMDFILVIRYHPTDIQNSFRQLATHCCSVAIWLPDGVLVGNKLLGAYA